MNWSMVRGPLLKLSELNGKLLSRMSFANVRAMHRFGGLSSIPFPVLNLVNARAGGAKGANSFLRLETIVARMPRDAKQVIDIGSNNGFFSIALGAQGYDVIGYEPSARFVRAATQICERFGVGNVTFFIKALDPDNSRHVFDGDVSLVLSVYHNWVKQFGFDGANQILTNLWAKTRMTMFFELASTMDNAYIAGFETMPRMGETTEACRAFMETKILGDLPGAQIEFVGLMPTDYNNGTSRHFFVVRRK